MPEADHPETLASALRLIHGFPTTISKPFFRDSRRHFASGLTQKGGVSTLR